MRVGWREERKVRVFEMMGKKVADERRSAFGPGRERQGSRRTPGEACEDNDISCSSPITRSGDLPYPICEQAKMKHPFEERKP